MKTHCRSMYRVATVALLTLPTLVQAHPGHTPDAGFAAGALHPLTGLDHLMGILVAGLLLGALPERWRWPVGAAFLMLLGTTHALWRAPVDTGVDFLAGLIASSAILIAAGIAATRMASRLTASATRSRTLAEAAAPARHRCVRPGLHE